MDNSVTPLDVYRRILARADADDARRTHTLRYPGSCSPCVRSYWRRVAWRSHLVRPMVERDERYDAQGELRVVGGE